VKFLINGMSESPTNINVDPHIFLLEKVPSPKEPNCILGVCLNDDLTFFHVN
jgi:hypothetical protein